MALYFEDLHVGEIFTTHGRTITETDIVSYSGLSGDFNALHTDAEFAKTTPYGQRIAHGPLVLAITMGLSNQMGLFEGTALGFLAIEEWKFLGAVCIGDTIHGEFTVTGLRRTTKPGRGIVTREVQVVNQHGEVVQQGRMVTMVRAATDGEQR
jgi:acyl dehydratase